jgi:hypothetical protein
MERPTAMISGVKVRASRFLAFEVFLDFFERFAFRLRQEERGGDENKSPQTTVNAKNMVA